MYDHKRHSRDHILFIIHLPPKDVQSSFVGFQSDPWISTHIDDLTPSNFPLTEAIDKPMSQLFVAEAKSEGPSEDDDMSNEPTGNVSNSEDEAEEPESFIAQALWFKLPEEQDETLASISKRDSEEAAQSREDSLCTMHGYFQALHNCIQKATARNPGRNIEQIEILVDLIPTKPEHIGKLVILM